MPRMVEYMRETFVNTLLSISESDPRLVVVTADMGYSVFERFEGARKGQFLNVGIAEANMIGVSAGLALCGKRPIAYSITPFITIRDLEQVRVDVCYHELPVMLIGSGAGLCYGSLGPTHHGTEDIAVMRAMPNMTVAAPADRHELASILRQGYAAGRPIYIRIGRSVEPQVYGQEKPEITLGKGTVVEDHGDGFALIACGNMVYSSLQAMKILSGMGKNGKLISMHTIKPLDKALVRSLAAKMKVFTVEEHSIIGGLGSAVAEELADMGGATMGLDRIALPDSFQKKVGCHEYLRKINDLAPDDIAKRVAGKL